MNLLKKLSLLLVILTLLSCFGNRQEASEDSITVMAYYMAPREDYRPQNLPLEKLTHIIFSFTEVIDNEMKFKNPALGEKLSLLVDQKKNTRALK